LIVLKKVIDICRFSVITFEHDVWRGTPETELVRNESRKILQSRGYQLVANDVTIEPGKGYGINNDPIIFEDWYVDPTCIKKEIVDAYTCLSSTTAPKYYTTVLFKKE
jgi:hypothetical protein